MLFRLNEEKVNSKYDNYLRAYDIKVFSNEHGSGHLELFFTTIKDIKRDENGNEIIPPKFMDIGWIKIEIIIEKGNYLKFNYNGSIYELIQNKIFPKSDFLQSIFDKNY